MTQNNWKIHAALVISCMALGLSIYTTVRGSDPKSSGSRDPAAATPAPAAKPAEGVTAPGGAGSQALRPVRDPEPCGQRDPEPDGIFDIRTTDHSLAGAIMTITAITESGARDQVMIRIPR